MEEHASETATTGESKEAKRQQLSQGRAWSEERGAGEDDQGVTSNLACRPEGKGQWGREQRRETREGKREAAATPNPLDRREIRRERAR